MSPIWLCFRQLPDWQEEWWGEEQKFGYQKVVNKESIWYLCLGIPFQMDFSYWDQQQDIMLLAELGQDWPRLWSPAQPGAGPGGVGFGGYHRMKSWVGGYIRLPSRMWPGEQGSPLFLWRLEFATACWVWAALSFWVLIIAGRITVL